MRLTATIADKKHSRKKTCLRCCDSHNRSEPTLFCGHVTLVCLCMPGAVPFRADEPRGCYRPRTVPMTALA